MGEKSNKKKKGKVFFSPNERFSNKNHVFEICQKHGHT